jgi:CheY-like chemotaxis protein
VSATITPLRRGEPFNLLVVDADAVTRCLVCDELRGEGYRVLEASSGADAVSVLRSMPVHLVLVDLSLPGPVDGLATARFATDLRPRPKVILASIGPPDGTADLEEIGPRVSKPYSVPDVIEAVRRSLDPMAPGDGT